MKKSDEFITIEELATVLRVDARTIRRFIQRKEIPAIRIGRQWRFRSEWVDEWLEKNTTNRDEQSA